MENKEMNENMMENEIEKTEYRPEIAMDENGNPDSESLARGIREVLSRRNGHDLAVMHVGEKIDMADYFVLATASSNNHVRALADEVEYRLGLCGIKPDRSDGRGDGNSWMVLDYGSVLVHVFTLESRKFYALDKLFSDATKLEFAEEE